MKNRMKGFTLVELMVVVAIIGILATLAVPQVNKMMARARQSEARATLSAIYTANKAFFVEWNGYTSSFNPMGFTPEGQLRYNTGWINAPAVASCPQAYNSANAGQCAAAFNGTAAASNTGARCPVAFAAGAPCQSVPGTDGAAVLPTVIGAVDPAAGNGWQSFTAGAIAAIYSGAVNDQWTINQNKNIIHVTPTVP